MKKRPKADTRFEWDIVSIALIVLAIAFVVFLVFLVGSSHRFPILE